MAAKGETLARQPHGPPADAPLADTELRLAERARAGDHAAFDTLVRQHWAKVASVVSRFLSDPNDVEDATQETFIRAFERLSGFRGEAGLRTWLIRVAINICKNRRGGFWFRRVQLAPGDADVLANVSDAQALAEATLLRGEQNTVLLTALQRLPEKFRIPITLHYFEDLSGAEIAAILGWNESTVWSRIYAGCRSLRKTLGVSGQEP